MKLSAEDLKLEKIAKHIALVISSNIDLEKKYIEFLQKHNLPSSGPSIELLNKLNKTQRTELIEIINH